MCGIGLVIEGVQIKFENADCLSSAAEEELKKTSSGTSEQPGQNGRQGKDPIGPSVRDLAQVLSRRGPDACQVLTLPLPAPSTSSSDGDRSHVSTAVLSQQEEVEKLGVGMGVGVDGGGHLTGGDGGGGGGGSEAYADEGGNRRGTLGGGHLHLIGAELQLQGMEQVRQPFVDDLGNILLFNGEIFGGLPVHSEENDGQALLAALGKCCSCPLCQAGDPAPVCPDVPDRNDADSALLPADNILQPNGTIGRGDGESPVANPSPDGDAKIITTSPGCGGGIDDALPGGVHRSVPGVMSRLRGPWAFVYWQAEAGRVWYGRDVMGRRSLLLHAPSARDPRLLLSSVSPPSLLRRIFPTPPSAARATPAGPGAGTTAAYGADLTEPGVCLPGANLTGPVAHPVASGVHQTALGTNLTAPRACLRSPETPATDLAGPVACLAVPGDGDLTAPGAELTVAGSEGPEGQAELREGKEEQVQQEGEGSEEERAIEEKKEEEEVRKGEGNTGKREKVMERGRKGKKGSRDGEGGPPGKRGGEKERQKQVWKQMAEKRAKDEGEKRGRREGGKEREGEEKGGGGEVAEEEGAVGYAFHYWKEVPCGLFSISIHSGTGSGAVSVHTGTFSGALSGHNGTDSRTVSVHTGTRSELHSRTDLGIVSAFPGTDSGASRVHTGADAETSSACPGLGSGAGAVHTGTDAGTGSGFSCFTGVHRQHAWQDPLLVRLSASRRAAPSGATPAADRCPGTPGRDFGEARSGESAGAGEASCCREGEPQAPPSLESAAEKVMAALSEAVRRRVVSIRGFSLGHESDSSGRRRRGQEQDVSKRVQVAVLFSGGLDSMLLAVLADRHVAINRPIELLNVSFDGGRAPDRVAALAGLLELRQLSPRRTWQFVEVNASLADVDRHRHRLLSLISPAHTHMDLNIGAALWLAASANSGVDKDDSSHSSCHNCNSCDNCDSCDNCKCCTGTSGRFCGDGNSRNHAPPTTSGGGSQAPRIEQARAQHEAPRGLLLPQGRLQGQRPKKWGEREREGQAHGQGQGHWQGQGQGQGQLHAQKGEPKGEEQQHGQGLQEEEEEEEAAFVGRACVMLVGTGADEQCGGYARYRTKFKAGGWQALEEEMQFDVRRLWQRNLGRDDRCLSDCGKEARFPFLDEDVMELLLDLPLPIITDLSLPPGVGDKRILREVARMLGIRGAAALAKRAIQFGSRIARESNQRVFGSNRAANQASAGSLTIFGVANGGTEKPLGG